MIKAFWPSVRPALSRTLTTCHPHMSGRSSALQWCLREACLKKPSFSAVAWVVLAEAFSAIEGVVRIWDKAVIPRLFVLLSLGLRLLGGDHPYKSISESVLGSLPGLQHRAYRYS